MVSSSQLVRLCAGHKPMRMRAALETLNHAERQRGRASAHGGRAAVFQQHGCAGISEGGTKRWKYGMSRPFYLKRAQCSPRADSVRIRSHRRIPPAICPIPTNYMQIWYITRGCCEHWVEGQKHLMARGRYPSSFLRRSSIRWCGWKMPRSSAANFLLTIFSARGEQRYQQVHEAALNLSFAWLFLQGCR